MTVTHALTLIVRRVVVFQLALLCPPCNVGGQINGKRSNLRPTLKRERGLRKPLNVGAVEDTVPEMFLQWVAGDLTTNRMRV